MQSEPGVYAKFHYQPVLDGAASRSAGRPVYQDRLYVEIAVAGQDKQMVNRPAQDKDKVRFAHEWAAFERGEESKRTGTPLGQWPRLATSPALVKSLEAANIYTVEDVASLTDETIPKLGMGGYKLREEAQRYVAGANTVNPSEVEALREQNKMLLERLEALEAKRKVGRPKKEAVTP